MQLPLFGAEDEVLKRKVLQIHERLCHEYLCPVTYFRRLDPLSELVSSFRSHRTRNRDSGQAFRNLKERFGATEEGWRMMMEAPVAVIEELIADVTWPEQKALPVDSHHHRVAVRTGQLPESITVSAAHPILESLLPPEWDAQAVYDHHEVMMFHGQKCCYFKGPQCRRCVILELCPTGHRRMSEVSGFMQRVTRSATPAEKR